MKDIFRGLAPYDGKFVTQKEHETRESHALLLGCFFETAGHMEFALKKETGTVYPKMGYNDNRRLKIYRFHEKFGGYVSQQYPYQSWRWSFQYNDAVEIATLIQPYAPFRSEYILAFQNWQNATCTEEKLKIAEDLREYAHQQQNSDTLVTKEDYLNLVNEPMYVAGAFESRGAICYRKSRSGIIDIQNPFINIRSSNKSLRKAIQLKYGGSNPPGSNDLRLGKVDSAVLLKDIFPHLITPLSEYERHPAIVNEEELLVLSSASG